MWENSIDYVKDLSDDRLLCCCLIYQSQLVILVMSFIEIKMKSYEKAVIESICMMGFASLYKIYIWCHRTMPLFFLWLILLLSPHHSTPISMLLPLIALVSKSKESYKKKKKKKKKIIFWRLSITFRHHHTWTFTIHMKLLHQLLSTLYGLKWNCYRMYKYMNISILYNMLCSFCTETCPYFTPQYSHGYFFLKYTI